MRIGIVVNDDTRELIADILSRHHEDDSMITGLGHKWMGFDGTKYEMEWLVINVKLLEIYDFPAHQALAHICDPAIGARLKDLRLSESLQERLVKYAATSLEITVGELWNKYTSEELVRISCMCDEDLRELDMSTAELGIVCGWWCTPPEDAPD